MLKMSEILTKFKGLKLTKKNILLVAVCLLMLLMILCSEIFSEEEKNLSPTDNTGDFSSQYIEETEKRLEKLLEEIKDAGDVRVMLTLESCFENVYAVGEKVKEEADENNKQREFEEEYIIIKNGSNTEECLVVKVYQPVIKGVAVVAEGADNPTVKNAVTQTVCALFDINSTKVSVEKMMNN